MLLVVHVSKEFHIFHVLMFVYKIIGKKNHSLDWYETNIHITILYPVLGHYPCKDCAHHKSHLFSHKSPASQSITSQLCMIAFFNQKNRILEESQAILWKA